MFRKTIFMSLPLLLLAAACIPVGSIEVGVEPTAVIVTPLPTEEPQAVEPTPIITEGPAGSGTVTGDVCYPSEFIPAMTLYFRSTLDGATFAAPHAVNAATYSIDLPAGSYIAFAYPAGEAALAGLYSAAVACGLSVDCVEHDPLPFDVVAGQTTADIDLCDWYAPPGAVPVNPEASFQTNPQLAGLIYRNLTAGGIWRVGEGGRAVPLLSKWSAVISADGTQALFEENDDVYLADLATGTWRNLTNTPERWESSPQFVPGDAGQVFFFSGGMADERMSAAMTVVSTDGSGYALLDERLTSIPPSFSPDGSLMAFSLGDTAWVYNLPNATVEQFDPAVYGLGGVRSIASPSWSPDGSRLAWWVVTGEPESSTTALAIFDLGEGLGSGSVSLVHPYQPIGGGGYNSNPVWSPDGRWLATTVLSEDSKASLWVFSIDGEEVNLGDSAYPVWSVDGAALVLTRWPENGGPAWEGTTELVVTGEWQFNLLDLNPGSIPLAFVGE